MFSLQTPTQSYEARENSEENFQHNKTHTQNFHSLPRFIQKSSPIFGRAIAIEKSFQNRKRLRKVRSQNRNSIALISMKSCPPTCTHKHEHVIAPLLVPIERYRCDGGGEKLKRNSVLFDKTSPWLVYQSQSSKKHFPPTHTLESILKPSTVLLGFSQFS